MEKERSGVRNGFPLQPENTKQLLSYGSLGMYMHGKSDTRMQRFICTLNNRSCKAPTPYPRRVPAEWPPCDGGNMLLLS